jgi:hypothetical protein
MPQPTANRRLHRLLARTAPGRHRAALAATLILAASSGAIAYAASASHVVPPGGKAAGQSYAYWLGVKERVFFDSSGSPASCETLSAPTGSVTYLVGGGACTVPAGRSIYVDGVDNECSTYAGDHAGSGTSAAQLERCARAGFKAVHGTATLDGMPVTDYVQLIAAAAAVAVHVPKSNHFGLKPGSGRSAAYGEGLLLQGLPPGTHTIHITTSTPGGTNHFEYTLHVS